MKNSRCRCRTLEQNKKQGWKFLNTDCRPDCYTIIKRTLTLLKQTRKQYQEGKQDKYGKIHCHRVGVRLRVGGRVLNSRKEKEKHCPIRYWWGLKVRPQPWKAESELTGWAKPSIPSVLLHIKIFSFWKPIFRYNF